jgi:hypothetical protein
MPVSYAVVKLSKDVPPFVGVDGAKYALKKGDVAIIPAPNAKELINIGAAIETKRYYRTYLARKQHREEGDFSILNEISKMKGFKGGKVGERRIDPIEQYAEYLAKDMGFKGRKKGEIFEGQKVDADVSPLEEWREFYRKRGQRVTYWDLVPQEEYDNALEMLKQKWIIEHHKFLEFCDELEKDIRSWFEKTKKREAGLSVEDAMVHLDEYHRTHHDSMNIYTRDDFLIGLKYCFPEKGIGVTTKKMKTKPEEQYKTYIIFEQL